MTRPAKSALPNASRPANARECGCSEIVLRGDLRGLQQDGVPERFEPANQASGDTVEILSDEVVVSEVAVQLAGLKHVADGGEDRVSDRGQRLGATSSAAQSVVLRGER
jgi:hypothetical protein